MADNARFIKHEHRARIEALVFEENAVGLADRTVRPVVRQKRKRNPAKLLRPSLQARPGVGADLENLYIQRLELVVVLTEPEDLIFSSTCECERQK